MVDFDPWTIKRKRGSVWRVNFLSGVKGELFLCWHRVREHQEGIRMSPNGISGKALPWKRADFYFFPTLFFFFFFFSATSWARRLSSCLGTFGVYIAVADDTPNVHWRCCLLVCVQKWPRAWSLHLFHENQQLCSRFSLRPQTQIVRDRIISFMHFTCCLTTSSSPSTHLSPLPSPSSSSSLLLLFFSSERWVLLLSCCPASHWASDGCMVSAAGWERAEGGGGGHDLFYQHQHFWYSGCWLWEQKLYLCHWFGTHSCISLSEELVLIVSVPYLVTVFTTSRFLG